MNIDTIPIKSLADWASLSERRIRQLIAEGRLPKQTDGELPMPEAIKRLFEHCRGGSTQLADERLLLVRARRKIAERQFTEANGGELVPIRVLEDGTKHVGYFLDRLVSDLYISGIPMDQTQRATVQRLASRAQSDFKIYVRQWLDRQGEIAREREAKSA